MCIRDSTYFLGDKELKGITGMISRQLFPDKYKEVPEFVLKRAAEKGRRIHGQCQFVDCTGLPPESVEAENYLKERMNAGYKVVANEYTVSDNEYFASNIDCVWSKDERISIADIKTTYNLDKDCLLYTSFKDGAFKKFYSSLKIFPYCFNAIFLMSVSYFVSANPIYLQT